MRKVLLHLGAVLLCGGLLCSGPASSQTVERAVEDAFWDSVKGCTSAAEVEAYLEEFSKGRHVGAARACLKLLRHRADRERDARKWPAGKTFRDCPECPEMVVVPAGTFVMGSPPGERGRNTNEGPQRRVTIPTTFAVGKYEVTRGEFARFVQATKDRMGNCTVWEGGKWLWHFNRNWRKPGFNQNDRHPVVCVSWLDAQAYANWLSSKSGKHYRLLTEAEWEYAARAGTTMSRYWGDDASAQCAYANAADRTFQERYSNRKGGVAPCWDGSAHTAPVGSFRANRFGLHDMLGNVGEWVEDCWQNDHRGALSDARPRTVGGNCSQPVLRGNSWFTSPRYLRAAQRQWGFGERPGVLSGFRVARTLVP